MCVLFWSAAFLPQIGGIGVLAAQLLPAMRKRGYEYSVVTSNFREARAKALKESIDIARAIAEVQYER
jgi:hypothetical protein